MKARGKGRRGPRRPRRSRADIPEIVKTVLQSDQIPRQQPVYISKAEYLDIDGNLKGREQEFEREGIRFERGVKYSPVSLGLMRAFRAGRIPVSVLRGMVGREDVFGKYGKGVGP